jgi:hypothetical protein
MCVSVAEEKGFYCDMASDKYVHFDALKLRVLIR